MLISTKTNLIRQNYRQSVSLQPHFYSILQITPLRTSSRNSTHFIDPIRLSLTNKTTKYNKEYLILVIPGNKSRSLWRLRYHLLFTQITFNLQNFIVMCNSSLVDQSYISPSIIILCTNLIPFLPVVILQTRPR